MRKLKYSGVKCACRKNRASPGGNRRQWSGFCRRSSPWYRVRDLHCHLFSPFLLCVLFYPHISSIFSLYYYLEVQRVFSLVFTKRTSHPQNFFSVDLTSTSYANDNNISAVDIFCFLFPPSHPTTIFICLFVFCALLSYSISVCYNWVMPKG